MSLILPFALLLQTPAPVPVPFDDTRDATVGEARFVPAPLVDDSVPLPIPARYEVGEQADLLLEPASGDPFFLGFAAGKHYPPEGERVDPLLRSISERLTQDGRGEARTYGFVMFSKRMTEQRVRELETLGAKVLEFHPFYTLKVSFDPARLDELAAADFVRWVGAVQPWQKLHPDAVEFFGRAAAGERVRVYINVFESDLCEASARVLVAPAMESDPDGNRKRGNPEFDAYDTFANGWQQKALEGLGIEVGPWTESVRAFEAQVPKERLEDLVALDFVQFIDPVRDWDYDHDEAMPLANADRTRAAYNGGTNSVAQTGFIDSGYYSAHTALDAWVVGWDYSGAGDPFDDTNGHGSHVAGTILGNDDVDDSYQGAAPGLGLTTSRRFFVVRNGGGASFATRLSKMNSSYNDGTNTSPAPMVVSNSYSTNVVTSAYIGSETECRTIDSNAFDNDQLWIWSASNEGPTSGTLGLESSAKNAITIGNALKSRSTSVGDPGTIWSGSSRGPCGDGRWKPNLSAPGQSLLSVQAGTTTGYVLKGGTSMSTPLVSGVASQLCDHYSFLRYNPSALSAVLMAATLSYADQLIDSPSTDVTHLNSYGVGRLDAHKAHWGSTQQGLAFWSFEQGWLTGGVELNFNVAAGATRLTVVYHYKETPASSGASQALVNDIDMILDASPFTGSINTGDYTAHQSSVDNSEVRMINNPTATSWKVKLNPASIAPFQNTRGGVCVIVTYGDTTPSPTLSVSATDTFVQVGADVTFAATYSNPSTFASAVYFDSTSTGDTLQASFNTLIDGATADLMGNSTSGRDVTMGNVLHNTSRTHRWTTRWATEGLKTFSVQARSDNATDVSDSVGGLRRQHSSALADGPAVLDSHPGRVDQRRHHHVHVVASRGQRVGDRWLWGLHLVRHGRQSERSQGHRAGSHVQRDPRAGLLALQPAPGGQQRQLERELRERRSVPHRHHRTGGGHRPRFGHAPGQRAEMHDDRGGQLDGRGRHRWLGDRRIRGPVGHESRDRARGCAQHLRGIDELLAVDRLVDDRSLLPPAGARPRRQLGRDCALRTDLRQRELGARVLHGQDQLARLRALDRHERQPAVEERGQFHGDVHQHAQPEVRPAVLRHPAAKHALPRRHAVRRLADDPDHQHELGWKRERQRLLGYLQLQLLDGRDEPVRHGSG